MNVTAPVRALLVAAFALVSSSGPLLAQARPKLVVILTVDQMRADYVDRYGHHWTKGLDRLIDHGARFTNAAYPYLNTVTCAGHATIGTGSYPATHGMVLNQWLDRATAKATTCTADIDSPLVTYGPHGNGGESPAKMLVTTFADELRMQSAVHPRIVSISGKARAAITLAGRRGDAVLWFDGSRGWATSTWYRKAPDPFLERYFAKHPVEADFGAEWTRLLPESAYLFDDDVEHERRTLGGATFPHVLKGKAASPDETFYDAWEGSPFGDAYMGKMAAALVDELKMGQGAGTDFLAVSFSALDLTGHAYGPHSHEVQDVLARLDVTIGALLDDLDRLVGAGRYVVAFSSDHGVSPNPDLMRRMGVDAGRIDPRRLGEGALSVSRQPDLHPIDQLLAPYLGAGRYVAGVIYTDLYFLPGAYEKIVARPEAMRAVLKAIEETPGVARVFRADELRAGHYANDSLARAALLNYVPGRSGDLIIVPKPYWISSTANATHGSANEYDARVPLMLFGAGIRPGVYSSPSSPADIAATFAHMTGVTLPRPDGRILVEALK